MKKEYLNDIEELLNIALQEIEYININKDYNFERELIFKAYQEIVRKIKSKEKE